MGSSKQPRFAMRKAVTRTRTGGMMRWGRDDRSAGTASGVLVLLVVAALYGCATLRTQPKAVGAPPVASQPAEGARTFRASLLSVGMSKREVRRLEPKPTRILTMESSTMTVEEWLYEEKGRIVALYFTNGYLSSW